MGGIADPLLNPAVGAGIGVVGVLLAIIFGIYAVVSNRRNKRVKEPCWAIRTSYLVSRHSKQLKNLEVRYGGQTVDRLAVSELMFWNSGKDTIKRADIPESNPIRVQASRGVRILDAEILAVNSLSRPTIPFSETEAKLVFDYIEEGEGIVFQVVHDGADEDAIRVDGHILGAAELRRVESFNADFMKDLSSKFFWRELFRSILLGRLASTIIVVLVTSVLVAFFNISRLRSSGQSPEIQDYLPVTLALVLGIVAGFGSAGWRRVVGPKQPRGFRTVEK